MDSGEGLKDLHLLTSASALKELDTSNKGISQQEAESRMERFGPNILKEGKKTPKWVKFLKQFTDVLVIVLLIAAVVTAIIEPTGIDWIVIAAIVLINATIGYIQEEKAEDAIEKLKKMSSPKAVVMRKGKKKKVDASELVPGDIIRIRIGDIVPADAKLLEGDPVEVDQTALTGEALPVSREAGQVA